MINNTGSNRVFTPAEMTTALSIVSAVLAVSVHGYVKSNSTVKSAIRVIISGNTDSAAGRRAFENHAPIGVYVPESCD
jgi:hypothetical protein